MTLTQNAQGVWTDASGSSEGYSSIPGNFNPETGQPASASLGSLAPTMPTAPTGGYSQFTLNMASLMNQLQQATQAGNANLSGTKNALVNESVTTAPGFNPKIDAGANAQNMSSSTDAFQPAITGASNFMQNFANNSQVAATNLQTSVDLLKPTINNNTLVYPDGSVGYLGAVYNPTPQINTDPNSTGYGNLDYIATNPQPGQSPWLSDAKSQNNQTNPPPIISPTTSSTASSTNKILVGGVNVAGYNGYVNPTYSADVNRSYLDLEKQAPIPTAQSLDAYIQNNAKGSPVTGQMILNAAATYGVPPNVLAAVLNDESAFGTVGQGVKTMNPGNNGNTGKSTITYSTWQKGVDAAAATLSKYTEGGNSTSADVATSTQGSNPSSSTVTNVSGGMSSADPKGNQISTIYGGRVSQLSSSIQRYVTAGPAGVAYIDGDAATAAGLGQVVALQASKSGVSILTGNDASIMDNMNNLIQQVQSMGALVNKNLGTDTSGGGSSTGQHIANSLTSWLNTVTQNNPDKTQMDAYIGSVTSAAATIKGLAGGAGSGLRITGFELGATGDTFPQTGDSAATAQAKINALNTKISQWMNTNFPDVSASQVVLPQLQAGTTVKMVGPKGTYSVPADKAQSYADNGYSIQYGS